MRVVRYCLATVVLSPVFLVNLGCSGDDTGKVTGPVDASKAYKSSDEAQKEMMKANPLPQKK